jgi:hypothetical protein
MELPGEIPCSYYPQRPDIPPPVETKSRTLGGCAFLALVVQDK